MDEQITKQRDKGSFRLLGKWSTTNRCVFLLDQYAAFDWEKDSPHSFTGNRNGTRITGPSYRHATRTLETLLGYSVLSYEGIRQQMLGAELIPKKTELIQRVLFAEVDGLYLKLQEKSKKGNEEKIAAVHQGWEVNEKRNQHGRNAGNGEC
ncbi:MAG: UPF0236 family transposase-like protein [Bacillota bacterium]